MMTPMARQDPIGIVVSAATEPGGDVFGRALGATLQSLRDQTEDQLEVVVVGPAGPPAGGDWGGPRWVASEAPGSAAAFQCGRAELQTTWIRFLSAGDFLAPGCLAADRAALEEAPGLAAVFSGCERVREDGLPIGSDVGTSPAVGPGTYAAGLLVPELIASNPFPLASGLLRAEVFDEIGGFDATYEARPEHPLWLRLLGAGAIRVRKDLDVRLREPRLAPVDPAVDASEHARALLEALRGDALEAVVAALGGGPRDSAPNGIARTELARRLLASECVELRPLAVRLVREAREVGSYFPLDAPFEEMARDFPEVARMEGWFPPPAVEEERDRAPAVPASGGFPPVVRVALGTSGDDFAHADLALRLATMRDELAAFGVDPVAVHARAAREEQAPRFGLPTEILRHPGSAEEAEAVLVRLGVSVLIAPAAHPAAVVAERCGVALLPEAPTHDGPGSLARELVGAAATSAARMLRSSVTEHRKVAHALGAGAREDGVLRALTRTIGEASAGSRVGDRALLDGLRDARREIEWAHSRARATDAAARRAFDKLRIGRRLRSTFAAPARPADAPAPVVSLDETVARSFLQAAEEAAPARLWVVYTTDPYSETQGQRSTWLARELLERGDFVVFFYWRWHLSEEIAESPHDRLLPVPIDQLFRLQRPLIDLSAPGLDKIFLIEFPDAALFEQIDLFGAHGFTTVYDCVDDWEEFARVGQAHWYDPGVEAHLACHADLIVATHPVLAKRVEQMGSPPGRVALVPNGVAPASLADAEPRVRGGKPVVGYFGHLTPAWFDWDLVCETARARPEWTFDIVGHGAPEDLDLPENVRAPGPVPHERLPERTRDWHVGIVPFRPGRLTRAVDPIKLYEYLALGLPAVVVDMPHLAGVPAVEVCTRDDFAAGIDRALAAEPDAPAMAAFVASSRWSARADAIVEGVARSAPEALRKALS